MICSWFAFLYFLIIGQFGQVFKAKLTRNGEKTTVAVKTLRNNPERIEVENLISELKIMIHLGSHDNIVNVIGACTKRLPDQELYVLVEYCEHGNILDVLRRHKASFRWVMERTITISLALWLPICIYSHNTTYIESKSKKNFSLQVWVANLSFFNFSRKTKNFRPFFAKNEKKTKKILPTKIVEIWTIFEKLLAKNF